MNILHKGVGVVTNMVKGYLCQMYEKREKILTKKPCDVGICRGFFAVAEKFEAVVYKCSKISLDRFTKV